MHSCGKRLMHTPVVKIQRYLRNKYEFRLEQELGSQDELICIGSVTAASYPVFGL